MGQDITTPRSQNLVYLSHIFGWIYFSAWTASFYPQLVSNHRKKSTEGLSYTFALFNLIGFIALATFNVIRYQVQRAYHLSEAVEIQDLCFALHAVLLSLAICIQILVYDRRHLAERLNRKSVIAAICTVLIFIIHIGLAACYVFPITIVPSTNPDQYVTTAWTFTSFAGVVKIVVTLVKYIPQIFLNHERQMTRGLAIWNFNLDFTGGFFSLAQNLLSAVNFQDFAYISGNLPKIGIGLVGLVYNVIILTQHYYLYREKNEGERARLNGLNGALSRKTTTDDGVEVIDTVPILKYVS